MNLQIGDYVTWTSQSAGTTKTKAGSVVAIVPVGANPDTVIAGDLWADHRYRGFAYVWTGSYGLPRNHESYLIAVGRKLYWPRVSLLQPEVKIVEDVT